LASDEKEHVAKSTNKEPRKTVPVAKDLHDELAHRAINKGHTLIEETDETLRLGLKRGSP